MAARTRRLVDCSILTSSTQANILAACHFVADFSRTKSTGRNETQPLPSRTLRDIQKDFQKAIDINDIQKAVQLQQKYDAAEDAVPNLYMHNQILMAYAKRRQVNDAFEVAENIRKAGMQPDAYTFGALLNVCAKAEHPPYDLPREFAKKAEDIFQELLDSDVLPNSVHYHTLMDSQAKAGLVDKAFAIYEKMKKQGLPPTGLTLNILLSACSRACQPWRAMETLERMLKLPGVKADTATWNNILGAFARAKDMDGAYDAWQQMQNSEIIPDDITLKALSQAFCQNATLAKELVSEAAEVRQRLLQGHNRVPALELSKASKRQTTASSEVINKPLWLDLHGLSISAARMAVLQRLEYLVKHRSEEIQGVRSSQGKEDIGNINAASLVGSANYPAGAAGGLVIVTGVGNHSKVGHEGHLQRATLALLKSQTIRAHQDTANPGRLLVDNASLSQFLDLQRDVDLKWQFLHSAGMRVVFMGAGMCSLCAAVLLVPRLLML